MDLSKKLESEIVQGLEVMEDMDISSEEYGEAANNVSKLCNELIALEKYERDSENSEIDRMITINKNKKEYKNELIKNVVNIGGIVVSAAITIWGVLTTLNFETEGCVTTKAGNAMINNLFKHKF